MTSTSSETPNEINSQSTKDQDGDAENSVSMSTIPESLVQHLSARLETGRDKYDQIDDPFVKGINRDHAFVVARKYTCDDSVVQPVNTEMINQPTFRDQLSVLENMMGNKSQGDCLWINVLGVEEKLISGIGELCGPPPHTMVHQIRQSEHRHHRSHIEFNSSYTYIQLLVQDTPKSINKTPIYDMVKNEFRPNPPIPTIEKLGNAFANEDIGVDKLIRVGFISIFIIPSVNVLVTINHSYYDCPASRLVVHTGVVDTTIPGQLDIATNAQLLGLSMVNRFVGYSAGVIRNIEKLLRNWQEELRYTFSVDKVEEIHLLITYLQDFKKRLKPSKSIHAKLLQKVERDGGSKNSEYAVMMIQQSQETLDRVLEEIEDLIEQSKSLESFCFNMLSTRANTSMERLAIVTIVFLPLTFIASYFSMGFEEFSDLTKPPIYFWEISIRLSIAFFVIFAYSNLKRGLNRSLMILRKGRKWVRKQTHWWKLDVQLWWKQKRMSWRDGNKEGDRVYTHP